MPRRKPSGFSLVAFCRYCIIETVFLLTSKTAFAAYQRQKGYRCNPSRCPRIDIRVNSWMRVFCGGKKTSLLCNTSDIRAAFLNVHPCTFLTASFALRQNIAAVWNHGHPCPFEKGTFETLLNMSSLGTSGIRDKNMHGRRAYVRTVIFCEICIILVWISYEQYTYTISSIFLRCNTLCRIYLFCPYLVRCFDCYHR